MIYSRLTKRIEIASSGLTILVAIILMIINFPLPRDQEKPLKEVEETIPRKPIHPIKMAMISLPPPPEINTPQSPNRPPGIIKERKRAPVQAPLEKIKRKTPNPALNKRQKLSVTVANRDKETIAEGRVILKLLETGKGPDVEIAWPKSKELRERLYGVLSQCLGLNSGWMTAGGDLYMLSGIAGQPAHINPDQSSLFLRQSSGILPMKEKQILEQIKRHHSILDTQPVRLFDRITDAALLGALFRLIPREISNSPQIKAQYGLGGRGVIVKEIYVNGSPIEGQVHIQVGLLGKCR